MKKIIPNKNNICFCFSFLVSFLILLSGCATKWLKTDDGEFRLISPEKKIGNQNFVALYVKKGVSTNEWIYIIANAEAVKHYGDIPIFVRVRP